MMATAIMLLALGQLPVPAPVFVPETIEVDETCWWLAPRFRGGFAADFGDAWSFGGGLASAQSWSFQEFPAPRLLSYRTEQFDFGAAPQPIFGYRFGPSLGPRFRYGYDFGPGFFPYGRRFKIKNKIKIR